METKMTLSKLADIIIIISFFSVGLSAFFYLLIETVGYITDDIRDRRKAKKERKEAQKKLQEPEQQST